MVSGVSKKWKCHPLQYFEMRRSSPLYLQNKEDFSEFFNEENGIKLKFCQAQRLLWEKALFPERFSPLSTFICKKCNKKTKDLSICLECGCVFCKKDLLEHPCQIKYGIDISTQQLFTFKNNQRKFIFEPKIDRLITASKFAVIENLRISADLDTDGSVLPYPREPYLLPTYQHTSFITSVMQCVLSNSSMEKFFMSFPLNVHQINSLAYACHASLTKLFLAQNMGCDPCYHLFLAIVSRLVMNRDLEMEPSIFFIELMRKMDNFYKQNNIPTLKYIIGINHLTNFFCEACQATAQDNEYTFSLTSSNSADSHTLIESIANGLKYQSKHRCPTCSAPMRAEAHITSLPQTIVITPSNGHILLDIPMMLESNQLIPDLLPEQNVSYQLSSLVVSSSEISNSHYFAFVKKHKKWFKCEENSVAEVAESKVLSERSAILFYTRV